MRLPKIKYLFQNRALVLMYHRIYTPNTDPWSLSVSPINFEQHLQYLTNHYSIISTHELVRQLNSGRIINRSVALTFDDGYLDNFITAKPLLEKYSVPATFFITDDYITNKESFWWDELENIIVHTDTLPSVFSITFKGQTIHFELGNEAILNDELRLKQAGYTYKKLPTLRTQLYYKLWELFSPLLREEQVHLMQLIREWAGLTKEVTKTEGAMSVRQLKQLADHPLFTIGGHTKTHPSLSDHPQGVQEKEITENKRYLENLLKTNVEQFAYPSGNFGQSTTKLLKSNTFSAAFTTSSKPVVKNTDLYKIGRYQVMDWEKEIFGLKIKQWFRS